MTTCPECNDTGERDSGGTHPWGEPVYLPCDCKDAEIGKRWREDSSLVKWFPLTAERLAALEAENAALKREAHTWSKAAESYATDAERFRWLAEHTVATGLARWVHPFQFLAEAVDARRGLNRPPTPVGWSDTDWLKHLEEIRQNEAAYHRGPLPERGWD